MTSCSMMKLVLVLVPPVMVELQPILAAQCPIVLPSPAVLFHTGTVNENNIGALKFGDQNFDFLILQ